jgi:fatty-acyl-CoA synthase
MVIGSLACVTSGATIVLPSEGFDAAATLQTVAEHKCTSLYGVVRLCLFSHAKHLTLTPNLFFLIILWGFGCQPTMFIAALEHPNFGQYDLRSLRTGVMAGSPCPVQVMKRCVADMNLTEMTICTTGFTR